MAKAVLGVPMIDTGPCTDPTYNFQALASVLDALGNPGPDPGPGPDDPDNPGTPIDPDVIPVDPVYLDEDGNLVKPGDDGTVEVIEDGDGANSTTMQVYLKVKGTLLSPTSIDQSTTEFTLSGLTVQETMTVLIPYDSAIEGTKQVPDLSTGTITVQNDPPLRATTADSADPNQIWARYHYEDKKWYTDSLENWEKHARGRDTWDSTKAQQLGHDADDQSIDWVTAGALLVIGATTGAVTSSDTNFGVNGLSKMAGDWATAGLTEAPGSVSANNTFEWDIDSGGTVFIGYNEGTGEWEALQAKCPA